jgi:inosine-uridine nucleoside N-ribohydrolase
MLKQEPVDTVSIVAVGPLTNVATAAVEDPETFSRGAYLLPEKGYAENVVRELVIMGGTLILPGNVTPT